VVTGEFDARGTFPASATTLSRMMGASKGYSTGMDVVLVEFVQRGYEPYFEEVPRIFEWMEPLRRQKPPHDFAMHVLRASENRFYWLRANDLPRSVTESPVLAGSEHGTVTPMRLEGKIISPGNIIRLTSRAKTHTVWLSPELVSFEKPVTILSGGKQKYHKMPKSSIEDVLDDFAARADRQWIYTVRLDVN
jgi:hypothetical protein